MKRLILLLLLLACFTLTAFPATTAPPMMIDNLRSTTIGIGGRTNTTVLSGYDWGRGFTLDGTSQFMARTNSTIEFYNFEGGPELIANNGFESYVGVQDAGNSTFASWTQVNAGDAVYQATAGAQDGLNAVKLSGNAQTGILRQVMSVVPGTTYTLAFWAHGDGVDPIGPRITLTDLTHGVTILNNYNPGFSSVTWQYWSDAIVAPAGCTQFQLDLIQPPTPLSYAVFDSVHLRVSWDMSFVMWMNRLDDPTTVIRQYVLSRLQGDTNRIWYMSFVGNDEAPNTGKIRFGQNIDGLTPSGTVYSQTVLSTGQWYQVVATYQTSGLPGRQNAIAKLYVNGVLENTVSTFNPLYVPMRSSEVPISVGGTSVSGNVHWFHGSVGEVQILAGHCLSDLEVQQIYAGGIAALYPGAHTIAWYKWMGDDVASWFNDVSGNGNDLVGYGTAMTPVTFVGSNYVERAIDYSTDRTPGRVLMPTDLRVVGKIGTRIQNENQTAVMQADGVGGPGNGVNPNASFAVTDFFDTSGGLYMNVDPTGTFYSWIQSRAGLSASFFNLALNPWGGNVGIATTAPVATLHIDGNIGADNAAAPKGLLRLSALAGGTSGGLDLGADPTGTYYSWLQSRSSASATFLPLSLNPWGGNVGVGNTDPAVTLDVTGVVQGHSFIVGDVTGITIKTNTAPSTPGTVVRWFSVTNANDGAIYKIPLYQ